MQPIYYQDFVESRDKRREAWTRVFNRTAGWVGAEPNSGHYAIAELVRQGKVSAVVTQNVDNLHQDAGVPDDKVIEIVLAARKRKGLKEQIPPLNEFEDKL